MESIYVNDLYTLTYDEGETLESIKSVVVNYVSWTSELTVGHIGGGGGGFGFGCGGGGGIV